MLWTIIVILVALWLLGIVTEIGGGFIHVLLVVAAVVLLYNIISGKKNA